MSSETAPPPRPLAERCCNLGSRRSTRIETKVRQRALIDRVAKSVKRELKTLGLELKAWQMPNEEGRKQRHCVLHYTTAQIKERERKAARVSACAAASELAKRMQNKSPCRPAIKSRRIYTLSNIALQKDGVLEVLHQRQTLAAAEGAFMLPVYINLASRIDRRRSIESQMDREGMQAWRLEAATAADADPRIVTRTWDSSINCQYDTRTLPAKLAMSNGERGCAMSHAILWHACAACGDEAPPMLVLEDDAMICPKFLARSRKLVESIEEKIPAEQRTCLLYLGGDVMAWRDDAEAIKFGYGLREAEYVYQTSSYIIWPAAARKLLTELPIDGPADVYLSRLLLERKLRAFMCRPRLVYQAAPYENGDIDHTNIFA